jgi:hypothetical protein
MCFYIIVLSDDGFSFFSDSRVKEKNKYYWFSIHLSPYFIVTLEHIVLCHKTKKQFEKTGVVYN